MVLPALENILPKWKPNNPGIAMVERIMQPLRFIAYVSLLLFMLTNSTYAQPDDKIIKGNAGSTLLAKSFGVFNEPWAMTFLPGGDLLVTEKNGTLIMVHLEDRSKVSVKGIPNVAYGGQGGLGDIILHPQYKDTHWIYLSYAEQDESGKRGAVVARAVLRPGSARPTLENLEVIWRQKPKVGIWVLEDKKNARLVRLTPYE
jgi:glucose/arabinose dehydrogenase